MGQSNAKPLTIQQLNKNIEQNELKYRRYIIKGQKQDKKISSGAYGKVYEVQQKSNNYAMKIVPVKCAELNRIVMEAALMKELTSEFVVPIRQSFLTDDKKQFCIVMEQCENSIERIYHKFTLLDKKQYSRALIKAIAFLHKNKIVHRDIKLQNILKIRKRLKIGDFGVSAAQMLNLKSGVGTLFYQAKQIIEGQLYTHKVDSWSLGLTLLQLWAGKRIFQFNNRCNNIISLAFLRDFPSEQQLNLIQDTGIRKAVRGFLQQNQQLRLSVVDAQGQLQQYASKPYQIDGMFYINITNQLQNLSDIDMNAITNLAIRQSTLEQQYVQ